VSTIVINSLIVGSRVKVEIDPYATNVLGLLKQALGWHLLPSAQCRNDAEPHFIGDHVRGIHLRR
jgi:hypothetical protein